MGKMSNLQVQLEEIKANICDHYCKYPGIYQFENEDSEQAYQQMLEDVCEGCPLNYLEG